MTSKSTLAIVIAVAVLLSGCAGLAGLGGEETAAPTSTPIEGTAAGGAPTGGDDATETPAETTTTVAATPTTRAATSTATATTASTATPTATTPAPTPTSTPTATPAATSTATPTDTPTGTESGSVVERPDGLDDDQRYLVVRAVGSGESYYRIYVPGSIELGPEADREGADHPDRTIHLTETYIQGYVGDGGVDSYITGVSPGTMVNDGNATLAVYEDGERTDTLEPGEGLEGNTTIAPTTLPPPSDSENVVRVEAVGSGESMYFLSATEGLTLGNEADVPAEADRPDRWSPIGTNEIYGFVGDGGVDSYRTTGEVTSLSNDGNATLRVSVDGEPWNTVEPGESVGDRLSGD
ncbi:hypothetical protein [Halococcus hamelinensis]|uniref:Uncharacterized protein n=1 Tax=Halococcus hamelinensis 100A6 TaxID=1132509 RepID=M0M5D3_9EURY|nr:hypothetical protein [Halococcus hamelinensis]EMA39575.1 hypothetical protein C447_06341 [Halococcus hamelinensis 100A6]